MRAMAVTELYRSATVRETLSSYVGPGKNLWRMQLTGGEFEHDAKECR